MGFYFKALLLQKQCFSVMHELRSMSAPPCPPLLEAKEACACFRDPFFHFVCNEMALVTK